LFVFAFANILLFFGLSRQGLLKDSLVTLLYHSVTLLYRSVTLLYSSVTFLYRLMKW